MQPMLNIAIRAARSAGDHIVRKMNRLPDLKIEQKGHNDYVSEVDRQAEEKIIETLLSSYPNHGILAEESGEIEGSEDFRWIIDPLDGTVNFVNGIPHVSVSVALWDGATPLSGVVLDPLRDECFTAEAGAGAELNGAAIQVSPTENLEQAIVATGFAYDHGDHAAEYAAVVGSVLEVVNGIRRFGSAALDLAWVAAGRFDGYWELGVSPWDQAAGILLVREAGGRVTDPFGADSLPGTRLVLASNNVLHRPLADRVAPLVPQRLR